MTPEITETVGILDTLHVGSRRRWYPVTPAGRWDAHSRRARFLSTSVVHAKEMGSGATACGIPARSWLRMWEFEFPRETAATCDACRRTTESSSAAAA